MNINPIKSLGLWVRDQELESLLVQTTQHLILGVPMYSCHIWPLSETDGFGSYVVISVSLQILLKHLKFHWQILSKRIPLWSSWNTLCPQAFVSAILLVRGFSHFNCLEEEHGVSHSFLTSLQGFLQTRNHRNF